MLVEDVVKVLSSKTNRRIIQLLSVRDMTTMEIFHELSHEAPSYRQSIHKALQAMKSVGLVSKYYDDKDKSIRYHLEIEKVTLDFRRMLIE